MFWLQFWRALMSSLFLFTVSVVTHMCYTVTNTIHSFFFSCSLKDKSDKWCLSSVTPLCAMTIFLFCDIKRCSTIFLLLLIHVHPHTHMHTHTISRYPSSPRDCQQPAAQRGSSGFAWMRGNIQKCLLTVLFLIQPAKPANQPEGNIKKSLMLC